MKLWFHVLLDLQQLMGVWCLALISAMRIVLMDF